MSMDWWNWRNLTMTDDDRLAIAYLRHLALTASNDQARGAYNHAAEGIERGEHRR